MSLLEHPKAQALLADAEVSAAAVRGCRQRTQQFLRRYLPAFYREEQRELAEVVLQGKMSHLGRKTSEPIADQAGRQRKPVQHFVGAGAWDDEAFLRELRRHVAQERDAEEGVAVVDGSGFPKSGDKSCGVARQWCGRLGKVDNCQVGVFLALVGVRGVAPLDRRLYLPQDWAEEKFVKVHGRRHGVDVFLQRGKGEVGLADYEVRSWVGWHHPRTLSFLTLWFLIRETERVGKKTPAIPLPQMQELFARLLTPRLATSKELAEAIRIVLRRNEESRIHAWYAEHETFPPPRRRPEG